MKRNDLIRELVEAGCYFRRHGGKHDIYNELQKRQKSARSSSL